MNNFASLLKQFIDLLETTEVPYRIIVDNLKRQETEIRIQVGNCHYYCNSTETLEELIQLLTRVKNTPNVGFIKNNLE